MKTIVMKRQNATEDEGSAAAGTETLATTTDMVILRPTKKLGALLPPEKSVPVSHDTALGDWYVNRIVVDRQPLLLLVSSASLLPLLLPARDVRIRAKWLANTALQPTSRERNVVH
jgi:uncharacterized protein DUF6933